MAPKVRSIPRVARSRAYRRVVVAERKAFTLQSHDQKDEGILVEDGLGRQGNLGKKIPVRQEHTVKGGPGSGMVERRSGCL